MFDIRVGSKLGASFGIVGVLFVGVVAQFYNTLSNNQEQYETLVTVTQQKEIHALSINTFMLQSRRAEKDFLLRKKPKYIDKVRGLTDQVFAEADQLAEKEKLTGNHQGVEKARQIKSFMQTYHDAFMALADSWKKRD